MSEVLGYEVLLNVPYDQAIQSVTAALKTQGFGVLTRIDVQATLKEKLGIDFRPYIILGACNPPLAHRALEQAPEIGLLLPCNVTVEAHESGKTLVRFANPAMMVAATNRSDDPGLVEVTSTAQDKIQKVIATLENAQAVDSLLE